LAVSVGAQGLVTWAKKAFKPIPFMMSPTKKPKLPN